MASTGLQDFTGYTEVDTGNVLTTVAARATAANVTRDVDTYLYADFGASFFNSLTATFELLVNATSVPTTAAAAGGIGFANVIDDISGFGVTDINVLIVEETSGFKIFLERGPGTASDVYVGAADTIYYCLLKRSADSNTATLEIYSDANRTTLLDTLTISGVGTATRWRYCYGFVNWNGGYAGTEFDGYTANLKVYNATAGYIATYPTNPTTRVTSIIYRYDRGVYSTELLFGDIISDFSIPNVDTTTTKAYQNKEELDKINKALPEPFVITPQSIPQVPSSPVSSPPGIVEPTQYAKDILGTSVAKQKGIEQGIGAVATPYAIDVLKRNEEEAKLLTQIQKLTKAASATGITSYARSVLIKAAIDAKTRLKELYKQ